MPRAVAHRLTPARMDRLLQEYRAGDGCTVLARRFGVSESGVLAQLKRAGVAVRPANLGKLTVEDVAAMRRLREAGWTHRAIGERFGVTRQAVGRRLDRSPNTGSDQTGLD